MAVIALPTLLAVAILDVGGIATPGHAKSCTTATVATCGPWGYCDESIGTCICAPGREGPDCSRLRYPACRLHRDGEMACGTFVGPPSCACRLQCEALYGGMGRRAHELCWRPTDSAIDSTASARANGTSELSDLPADLEAIEFRRAIWPAYVKCDRPAKKDSKKCSKDFGRMGPKRAVRALGGSPLPNQRCPLACSHRGTCLMPLEPRDRNAETRYPLAGGGTYCAPGGNSGCVPAAVRPSGQPACICHAGYSGEGCETADASKCFNGCSTHGRCTGRFCLCDRGWQGLDCSLPVAPPKAATATTAAAALAQPKYAPTYIYPLPSSLSMEYVYQRDQLRRGQYYANLRFVEQALAKQDAVVADPEQAALFFVPVMVMQMVSNLWHPYTYLEEVRDHLMHAYPYWNRSQGADHVFFLTTDRAGCWKPFAIKNSIIITTLGFPAAEAYFGFESRLRWPRKGPQRRNNAYDTRRGSPATELDCYVPGKDVVVPVDAIVGRPEVAKLPRPGETFACRPPRKAKVLMFMGGAMSNMGRVEYSQGVRQAINRIYANDTDFVLGGSFTFDDLRDSVFCLAPSGWGWGWRLSYPNPTPTPTPTPNPTPTPTADPSQPACEEMHAVRRLSEYGMSTDSMSFPSCRRNSRLRVPSRDSCSVATSIEPLATSCRSWAWSGLGRLVMAWKSVTPHSYTHLRICFLRYGFCCSRSSTSSSAWL